jgi:peptidoglycan hydrolase-like protein with peptidoglycan-binding domain
MPILTTPLTQTSTPNAATKVLIAELHIELIKLGNPIDELTDRAPQIFGATTAQAVSAFQTQYGFSPNGTVDTLLGRLTRVAALVIDGNYPLMLTALQELLGLTLSAPAATNALLARFALIAGDYAIAKKFADRAPSAPGLVDIRRLLDPQQVKALPIEVVHPENFYTYRYQPLGNDTDAIIKRLKDLASANGFSRMRIEQEGDTGGEREPLPPVEPEPPIPLPEIPIANEARRKAVQQAASNAVMAIEQWQNANADFKKQHYKDAITAYSECEQKARYYFTQRYQVSISSKRRSIVSSLFEIEDSSIFLRSTLASRRLPISLVELKQQESISLLAENVLALDLQGKEVNPNAPNGGARLAESERVREQNWDKMLFLLITVFVPLARAEANRMQRQYDEAIKDLNHVLQPYSLIFKGVPRVISSDGQTEIVTPIRSVSPTCDFIERPFTRLLLAEVLLDKAESEYKSRLLERSIQPPTLKAQQTYQAVIENFRGEGEYVARVEQGKAVLERQINEKVAPAGNRPADTSSVLFQQLGKDSYIPTIEPVGSSLPGLERNLAPHTSLLKIEAPTSIRETNPRVYTLLLAAQARLTQLAANFNYLGYRDDYVPPWRFQFLLERARYFTEHAKSAQRDYLNFLSNAENDEFQELGASQTVAMEKSNVLIETARVDQVQLEVAASLQSLVLAASVETNAQTRMDNFTDFDDDMAGLEEDSSWLSAIGAVTGVAVAAGVAIATGGVGAVALGGSIWTGGASFLGDRNRSSQAQEQRDLEKKNLNLSKTEATKAKAVATANSQVAKAGLVVAGLQRQAALLRHEFAIQNLAFLRNRILSSEQWFRLAASIRSISETYLRYAIEIAFLAEQAYEFEADKQINVIRFDYDQSEVGSFLAGDFLLRDLDTLEQDLIVNQRQRQQEVRYVLSLAREFPQALQELRDNGKMTFSLVLEQIEHRFPGLFNARLGAVDVMPVALLDSTRFSLELTYLGSSQVRLRTQPGQPNPTDDWTVQTRVSGPETTIFSGLSRQEANAVFPFMSNGQRNAFEGFGAASAWQIDMSMQDNQVVPGTLADLLITFTLSGYYDAGLRQKVERDLPKTAVLTKWLSARQTFPDAFFDFNRTGKMVWPVSADLLSLSGSPGRLRNVGLLLLPAPSRIQFGRLQASYQVDFRVEADGTLNILSEIPAITFGIGVPGNPLQLNAQVTLQANATATWNFGDGKPIQSGATVQHGYDRPGKYTVTLRIVRNGRLKEFKAEIALSRTQKLTSPVTAFPQLTKVAGAIRATMISTAGDGALTAYWQLKDADTLKGTSVDFTNLTAGNYTLRCRAVRQLKVRVYSNQRFLPDRIVNMDSFTIATNRRFSPTGAEIPGTTPNSLAQQLFPTAAEPLSATDEWTVEMTLDDNPFLKSVSNSDIIQPDFSALQDVIWTMEYELNS